MPPRLLIAAHGTHSAAGLANTEALTAAIAAERPDASVSLCYLDVATPSLADALTTLGTDETVVVPLLLSAGYHVQTDIPALVAGRPSVRVAPHLGPDPLVVAAVADRLALPDDFAGTVLLAAIASTRSTARDEVATAAGLLAARLNRPVSVLALSSAADLAAYDGPLAVAVYLLAPGGFLTSLRSAVGGRGVVAEPIGVHPALVTLVWSRYDAACDKPATQ